ncbi:conserved hypothetical protein [Nocardia seriolae]|nr:conserved hypothetical protein [Nocardia seriolae]
METDIGPVGGTPQRRDRRAEPVGPAQSRIVVGEHRPDRIGPPGLVAWLDRHPHVGGNEGERGGQQLRCGGQGGRQLQQDGAQPISESAGRVDHALDRIPGIAQPPIVGERAARLHRHDEVRREPIPPALEDAAR